MTTIVGTRTAVYADSLITIGGESFNAKKIFKTRSGIIYASAGDSRLTDAFEAQMKAGAETIVKPGKDGEKEESFEGIVLHPDGTLIYYDDNFAPMFVMGDFICAGSGGMVARSWMLEGAPPDVAIEKASKVDNATGGPVQCIAIKSNKRKERAA